MTQTVNRYMYVNAKPINYCDPSGLWTFAIGLTGSLGAGGGITGSFDIAFDSQGNLGVLITGGGNIPSALRYLKNTIFGDSTQDRGAYPTK